MFTAMLKINRAHAPTLISALKGGKGEAADSTDVMANESSRRDGRKAATTTLVTRNSRTDGKSRISHRSAHHSEGEAASASFLVVLPFAHGRKSIKAILEEEGGC